eukprot:2783660-Rhodomonas_salina.2
MPGATQLPPSAHPRSPAHTFLSPTVLQQGVCAGVPADHHQWRPVVSCKPQPPRPQRIDLQSTTYLSSQSALSFANADVTTLVILTHQKSEGLLARAYACLSTSVLVLNLSSSCCTPLLGA